MRGSVRQLSVPGAVVETVHDHMDGIRAVHDLYGAAGVGGETMEWNSICNQGTKSRNCMADRTELLWVDGSAYTGNMAAAGNEGTGRGNLRGAGGTTLGRGVAGKTLEQRSMG